jgi:GH15 family glucan-1,4-alpha-glucosidase
MSSGSGENSNTGGWPRITEFSAGKGATMVGTVLVPGEGGGTAVRLAGSGPGAAGGALVAGEGGRVIVRVVGSGVGVVGGMMPGEGGGAAVAGDAGATVPGDAGATVAGDAGGTMPGDSGGPAPNVGAGANEPDGDPNEPAPELDPPNSCACAEGAWTARAAPKSAPNINPSLRRPSRLFLVLIRPPSFDPLANVGRPLIVCQVCKRARAGCMSGASAFLRVTRGRVPGRIQRIGMASRIEDYGLIGDQRTAALVSRQGDVAWLCAPRFDSDACFASLVGYDEHGRWSLHPTVPVRERAQTYRGDTLVLETEFRCEGGAARVIDFMPLTGEGRTDVVRILEGIDGEVSIEMVLDVRFGYGAEAPLVQAEPDGASFVAGPNAMAFRGPRGLEVGRRGVSHAFKLKKGDRIPMTLTWYPSHLQPPPAFDANESLAQTEAYWRDWAGRCTYQGPWRDAVLRSLITLKAMTYEPTGAIVAAPTTSLPEAIGGVRNWDYRFCWLRDASLTLDALMIGGYTEEALGFREWLFRTTAGDPESMQIMYDITGGRRLQEYELDWLPGYEGSRPVRVGNAASNQFQLDVYGELLSCLYAGGKLGLPKRVAAWPALLELLDFLETAWQRPDDGIWEVRGGRRHFTHSKVMAWVAIDRMYRGITELNVGGDKGHALLPHLGALRERIHEEVCTRGFNPAVGAFTQSYGSTELDASVLVIPHVGFLPANDPRMLGTVAAIERSLLREGFVLRYGTEAGTDGLPGSEGAFLACSFWLADNYALSGRIDDAKALFERLLGLRNHLGLLAEEYDPRLHRQVGNFPQAFSHLALVFTAQIMNMAAQGRLAQATHPLRGELSVEVALH